MSKSSDEVLASLKSQQSQLKSLARTLPDQIAAASQTIDDVVLAVTNATAEIQNLVVGVNALQIEAECIAAMTIELMMNMLIFG